VKAEGGQDAAAADLAERLGLELVDGPGESAGAAADGAPDERPDEPRGEPLEGAEGRYAGGPDLFLVRTGARLELRETGAGAAGPLAVEFLPGRGPSLLRRAALAGGGEPPRVIDATAGLGQDAFALAEWGCRVDLIERSPVVAALLEDGIARALARPETAAAATRMRLHQGDAVGLLPRLERAAVVYLDPMYPRSGREGRKAKGMRMLRRLLGDDPDSDALLEAARRAARRRVVVKRPLRAPPLAGMRPSGSLTGTTVRYDLYGPLSERPTGVGRDDDER
jgi:16S rRNA (guanine1516-N2)-methyltransferase